MNRNQQNLPCILHKEVCIRQYFSDGAILTIPIHQNSLSTILLQHSPSLTQTALINQGFINVNNAPQTIVNSQAMHPMHIAPPQISQTTVNRHTNKDA